MTTLTERKATYRYQVESQETYRDYVIDIVGVWGPLLAPSVPAALTMVSIAMHYPELLHIHWLAALMIGLIVAVVIEVLGVVSVETFLDMQSYNQTLDAGEEHAPAGWAGAIMALYIGIVLSLVVLLKMVPALALVSLVPLTLLAGVTSWIVVMRKQHRQRVYRKELVQLEAKQQDDLAAQVEELRRQLQVEIDARTQAEVALQKVTGEAAIAAEEQTEALSDLRRQLAVLASRSLDENHQTSTGFGPHTFPLAQEAKAASTQERQAKRRAILSGLLEAFPQGVSTAQAIEALKTSGISRGVSDKTVRGELRDLGAESGGGVWKLQDYSPPSIITNGHAT